MIFVLQLHLYHIHTLKWCKLYSRHYTHFWHCSEMVNGFKLSDKYRKMVLKKPPLKHNCSHYHNLHFFLSFDCTDENSTMLPCIKCVDFFSRCSTTLKLPKNEHKLNKLHIIFPNAPAFFHSVILLLLLLFMSSAAFSWQFVQLFY